MRKPICAEEIVNFKNTMRRDLIVLCLFLGVFLQFLGVLGVEAVEKVRKVEGESVTLHSGVQEYHRIFWLFGPHKKRIAQCWGIGTPQCEIIDEQLDRLKLDNQTGSLTIINIRNEDAGLYERQIFNNSTLVSPDKEFNLTVSAPLPIPTIVKDSEQSSGSICVLLCSVMNVTEATLSWCKGNSSISSVSVSDRNRRFSLPLEVNYQDINIYSCVLDNSISSQTLHLNITELCQLRPEPGYSELGVLGVLVVLGGIGVAVWSCWKKRQTQQNGIIYGYERNR